LKIEQAKIMDPSSSSRRKKSVSGGRGSRRGGLPSMGTVVATAALAVGTYHVAKWAWGVYEESNRKQQEQQQSVASMEVSASHKEREEEEEEETLVEIVEEELIEEEEEVLDVRVGGNSGTATHSGSRREHHDLVLEDDGERSVASHGVRFLLPGKGDDRDANHKKSSGTSDRSGTFTKPKNGKATAQSQSMTVSNPQVPPHPSSSAAPAPAIAPATSTSTGSASTGASTGASTVNKLNASHLKVRRQRMARCRDEAAMALSGFLSTVRRVVDERTDTLQELRELKKLRAERSRRHAAAAAASLSEETTAARREKELWERVKVRSVTKMMASAYAHSLLFLVLTVQVNLLGGRLFEEQIYRAHDNENDNEGHGHAGEESASVAAERRMSSYQASHRFVLTHTYEHFFSRGLVQLIDAVERAAADALAEWDVLDASSLNFTIDQFDGGIQQARALVGEAPSLSASGEARGLLRFLVPPFEGSAASAQLAGSDELARSILDETWDLLESPVLDDALVACLNTTFDVMRDQHWGTVFEDPSTSYTLSGTAGIAPHPAHHVHVPLATVLTKLKNTTGSLYEATRAASSHHADGVPAEATTTSGPAAAAVVVGSSSYCSALERLPTVLELADVSFG
jgi:peroxin-3